MSSDKPSSEKPLLEDAAQGLILKRIMIHFVEGEDEHPWLASVIDPLPVSVPGLDGKWTFHGHGTSPENALKEAVEHFIECGGTVQLGVEE